MGATSIWHWIILLLIVVLLFGRGKISEVMGDVAKGIKSFKKGMTEDETAQKAGETKAIDAAKAAEVRPTAEGSKIG
ncbi:MAG: twin-arginine translocase TatA/TatE family subunit [Hyphomicrobiaceae bacterium]|jgi:sec-independent protein translocase protein TatA